MLKLHTLLVETFNKIQRLMNKDITKRKRDGKHPTKNALFDIQTLANKLYYS